MEFFYNYVKITPLCRFFKSGRGKSSYFPRRHAAFQILERMFLEKKQFHQFFRAGGKRSVRFDGLEILRARMPEFRPERFQLRPCAPGFKIGVLEIAEPECRASTRAATVHHGGNGPQ